jgi:iron complex outermembrane receptor protein
MINDGVYVGRGLVTDGFDIETIEVLRGPQGTVMGKNSIGGAVLVTTKNPGDEWESKLRIAYDGFGSPGGMSSYLQYATGGPVSDNLKIRGVVHINDNEGWHKNMFDNSNHGAIESTMFRGTVVYDPSETLSVNFKFTHQETDGDGPSAQCFQLFDGGPSCVAPSFNRDRNSFDLNIDEAGYLEDTSESMVLKVEKDIDFGDGQITYIFGDSTYEMDSIGDIDGTPAFIFHAPQRATDDQSSHEIRYGGSFEKFDLLMGYMSHERNLTFQEMRILPSTLGGTEWNGGGDLLHESSAFFATVEIPLSEQLTLDLGIRKTKEDKEVSIASLSAGVTVLATGGPSNIYFLGTRDPRSIQSPAQASCQIFSGGCLRDFIDNDSWSSTSPRIGLTYVADENTTYYAYQAIGYRSGGYNMRNTAILALTPQKGPGPYDQEEATTTELGIKKSLGRGKVNFSYFSTELTDMQRVLNEAGPAGPVQYIKNTGDASMSGIELDMVYMLKNEIVVNLNVGTLNAKYDSVTYDITGDGTIDYNEYNLALPRAADLTYSLGLSKDFNIATWSANARVSYSYRDEVAYDDANIGKIGEQRLLDIGVDFYSPSEDISVGVYGKNLNDYVKHGNISPVSWGSFAPLMTGKVVGVELVYDF